MLTSNYNKFTHPVITSKFIVEIWLFRRAPKCKHPESTWDLMMIFDDSLTKFSHVIFQIKKSLNH